MNLHPSNPAPPLASGLRRLASGVCLLASVFWHPALVLAAGGGADYGRGPETDPVATAALVSVYAATSSLNTAVKTVQARTSAWETAATDAASATGDVATLQGEMLAVQGRTSTWETAATDAASATGDVATLQGEMLAVQVRTSVWETAATDAASATGDVATLTGYFGALGETSIVWASTLQTNTFYFNAQGILTNHVQEGP